MEKFLSKKSGKEIKEPNISDWRRTVTGDLTSAFRKYNGEKISLPEFVERGPFVKEIYNAKFKKIPTDFRPLHAEKINEIKNNPGSPLLSQQESGIRNSCALPYQLNADGELSDDKKSFEIIFSVENQLPGAQSDGSPFNVYTPGKYASSKDNNLKVYDKVKAWAYAVRTGEKLSAKWRLEDFESDSYHLRVYGPNGFFREFIGDKNNPALSVKLEYEQVKSSSQKFTGNIILRLKNLGDENHSIEVIDNSYKNPKQSVELDKTESKELVLNFQKSFNWYDISIRKTGNNLFERRYAGRVETGEAGKTDPLMGRV